MRRRLVMGRGRVGTAPDEAGRSARGACHAVAVAPPFEIVSIRNTGPTDNSALDTLYVVHLREGDGEPERFLFSVLERYGEPDDAELTAFMRHRADGFANDRSALEQFRERESPHPTDHPERRAIALRAPE